MSEDKKFVRSLKDVNYITLTEKAKTKFLLGDQILVSFIEQEAGAEFPIHSHECEQVLIILEGS
ncbi:MAG: hypothetical protein ABI478_09450, partial [Propionivibrio sp.]